MSPSTVSPATDSGPADGASGDTPAPAGRTRRTLTAPRAQLRARAAKARLSTPMPTDRLLGWLAPAAIALMAGILRFWRLGDPQTLVFDEKYYASEAADYLRWGVEYDPV